MTTLTTSIAIEAVKEVLGNKRTRVTEIDETTPLDALGFDSLDVAELFATLEERCEVELDPDSAQSLETVGDLVNLKIA
jgi:acyl carrier protein